MAIISIILLMVIIGGVVTACGSTSNTSNNPSGSAPIAVPTTSVPAGFTRYSGGEGIYTIVYPSDWNLGSGIFLQDFTGPAGQVFAVDIALSGTASQSDATKANTDTCHNVAASTGESTGTSPPTTITIDGHQWQQLDCGANGTVHYVSETTVYRGDIYSLGYGSPPATFASDRTQFFSVMEQSFTFFY